MPLPCTGNLSLLGPSQAAKPKQAMILRMSTEALDAMQQLNAELKFDFGENPGLHVGNAFFPVRTQQETSPHELYMQMASQPGKALRLHANIIGKLIVERELGERMETKVRGNSLRAAQDRIKRTTILTTGIPEQNAAPQPKSKHSKKKLPIGATRKIRPTVLSGIATHPSNHSPLVKAGGNIVRHRIIHILALGEKGTEEVLAHLSDFSIEDQRLAFDVLKEVADAISNKNEGGPPRIYRLKPEIFQDIRPHEYRQYSEFQRQTVLGIARAVLKRLGVSREDSLWEHFQPLPSSSSSSLSSSSLSSSNAAAQSRPKKSMEVSKSAPTTSDEGSRVIVPKEKPSRPKEVSSSDSRKQETPQGDVTPSNGIWDDDRRSSLKQLTKDKDKGTLQTRRPPGSGFKATKPSTSLISDKSSLQPTSPRPKAEVTIRERELAHVGPSKFSQDRTSLPVKRVAEPPRQTTQAKSRPLNQDKAAIPLTDDHSVAHDDESATLKRKKPPRDDLGIGNKHSNNAQLKRMRLAGDVSQGLGSDAKIKLPPSALPKKPESVVPPVKLRHTPHRESLLTHPHLTKVSLKPAARNSPSTSISSNPGSTSKSIKGPKRRGTTPIYTDTDDDEGNSDKPQTKLGNSMHTNAGMHRGQATVTSSGSGEGICVHDYTSLRSRYTAKYLDYFSVVQKLMREKIQLDNALKPADTINRTLDLNTDDFELMDSHDLEQLTSSFHTLRQELLTIRQTMDSNDIPDE